MPRALTANVNILTFHGKSRKGGVLASLQESVKEWVRAVWRRAKPGEEFSVPALSEATGIPLPALYRIENLEGKASDRTLKRIADALGADPPRLTVDVSGLTEPVNPLGWIGEAQAALDRAARLLRPPATAPAGDAGRAGRAIGKAGRRKKGQPPAGDQPKKAG